MATKIIKRYSTNGIAHIVNEESDPDSERGNTSGSTSKDWKNFYKNQKNKNLTLTQFDIATDIEIDADDLDYLRSKRTKKSTKAKSKRKTKKECKCK
jgi:hypothetical protein